ncbi:TetR/AcrR family transcriptional regulator [Paenibacillus allorhizosphaerae]|uniref:HTH tetR-type domain-containing protein n=1 Tax=Paenibacillus allorhizosphaerae TaxID=2849866 RepID=A0ABM8VE67_9BACL|nr:TetR/AcrR family transcriptional regulator [Paenibacillus allorhizosphaerae]CAG7630368.1 hypothetical protein PAECIP111802_01629 [Paenibacillus allorhizosphaerae]
MDKTDGRVIRTKQMLYEAFLNLIEAKGFDAITVRDLTTRAGLNRGTFYLHYEDKYDLLQKWKKEMLNGFEAQLSNFDLRVLLNHPTLEEPPQMILEIIQYFYEHARFFRIMLGSKGDPSYLNELKALMRKHMFNKMSSVQPNEELMMLPREFLIAYLISANLGMIQHWLESGLKYSPYHMALLLTRVSKLGPLNSVAAGIAAEQP